MNRIDKLALFLITMCIVVMGILVITLRTYITEARETREFIEKLQDRPLELNVRYIHED